MKLCWQVILVAEKCVCVVAFLRPAFSTNASVAQLAPSNEPLRWESLSSATNPNRDVFVKRATAQYEVRVRCRLTQLLSKWAAARNT